MYRAPHGRIRLAALPLAVAALAAASPAHATSRADQVIDALNAQRAAYGVPLLTADRSLAAVARAHSAHMVNRRSFSHGNFKGRIRRSAWARRRPAWTAGEALAWGIGRRGTPAEIVAAWMRSPPHRVIVLDPRYRVVGVGHVKGIPVHRAGGRRGRTYTADFGS